MQTSPTRADAFAPHSPWGNTSHSMGNEAFPVHSRADKRGMGSKRLSGRPPDPPPKGVPPRSRAGVEISPRQFGGEPSKACRWKGSPGSFPPPSPRGRPWSRAPYPTELLSDKPQDGAGRRGASSRHQAPWPLILVCLTDTSMTEKLHASGASRPSRSSLLGIGWIAGRINRTRLRGGTLPYRHLSQIDSESGLAYHDNRVSRRVKDELMAICRGLPLEGTVMSVRQQVA